MTSIHIHSSGVPADVRDSVGDAIRETIGSRQGEWEASINDDSENNAWDVEVQGPHLFHWARRFSGADRDANVISAAVNLAITTDPKVATISEN